MSIDIIKDKIIKNLGNEVFIKHNEGRNKIYEYSGRIVEVYNNIYKSILQRVSSSPASRRQC